MSELEELIMDVIDAKRIYESKLEGYFNVTRYGEISNDAPKRFYDRDKLENEIESKYIQITTGEKYVE